MPQQRSPRRDENEKKKLRDELRNLKKVNAPWYFESELQRRLHYVRTRAERKYWLKRPLPSLALSTVTVLALAAVGYYIFMLPGITPHEHPVEVEGSKAPGNEVTTPQPAIQPSPQLQDVTSDQLSRPQDARQTGPFAPREEPAVGSPAAHRVPDSNARNGEAGVQAQIELIIPAASESMRVTAGAISISDTNDSRKKADSASLKRDSLNVKPDSLRKPGSNTNR